MISPTNQIINNFPQTTKNGSRQQQRGSSTDNEIYLNVMLVDTFKNVYKQLDPLKKGYIKLKDLSEAVKGVDGESKRNALIKFFVSFINQTSKQYISKVSFLTNTVSACLHNKYDLSIFTQNIDLKAINKYKKNNYEQPMFKKQNT
eukprot:403348731